MGGRRPACACIRSCINLAAARPLSVPPGPSLGFDVTLVPGRALPHLLVVCLDHLGHLLDAEALGENIPSIPHSRGGVNALHVRPREAGLVRPRCQQPRVCRPPPPAIRSPTCPAHLQSSSVRHPLTHHPRPPPLPTCTSQLTRFHRYMPSTRYFTPPMFRSLMAAL